MVVIYLDSVTKRVHKSEIVPVNPITIRKTGVVHRERFMASSLYLLKISLYLKQFVTDRQNIINANILAGYVALIDTQYFLKCPLGIRALRLARDLACTYLDTGRVPA